MSEGLGSYIKIDCGGTLEVYELHSISYELKPTGVAVCTFNTPKNLNCLSQNQIWETFAVLEHLMREEEVKVAVWTGAGRAFGSGADLRGGGELFVPEHARAALRSRGMSQESDDRVLRALTKAFWDFPKPSIVAVNGMALGGHANMALMNYHDLVLASSEAKFMFPFAKLGFTPELGSSVLMPMVVGMARAKEIFFLGDWISAHQAKELGLVNWVVEPDQLLPEALRIAERLVGTHPKGLSFSKTLLNSHLRKNLDGVLVDENEAIRLSVGATGGPLAVAKWMKEKAAWLEKVKSEESRSKL